MKLIAGSRHHNLVFLWVFNRYPPRRHKYTILWISDEHLALYVLQITDRHVLVRTGTHIRENLTIDFSGVLLTLHQCFESKTVFCL